MKRLIAALVLSFICFHVIAEDQVKIFKGIGCNFMGTKSDKVPMQKQLEWIDSKLSSTSDLSIIGHSQGALRAIAYAGYLNKNDRSEKIKNVIGIGGPLNGYSPLLQGSAVLRNNIDNAANVINGGILALTNLGSKKPARTDTLVNGGVEGLLKTVGVKADISSLLASIDDSSTSYPDMRPGSVFIDKNVCHTEMEIKWVRIKYPFEMTYPFLQWKKVWSLPANVNYGFIVGTSSDVVTMANDKIGKIPLFWNLSISPKQIVDLYKNGTDFAEAAWLGLQCEPPRFHRRHFYVSPAATD